MFLGIEYGTSKKPYVALIHNKTDLPDVLCTAQIHQNHVQYKVLLLWFGKVGQVGKVSRLSWLCLLREYFWTGKVL